MAKHAIARRKPQGKTLLVVKIDNKSPVQLDRLAQGLMKFGQEYRDFAQGQGHPGDSEEVTLYVHHVQQGSIEVYLAAAMNALPDILDHAKLFKDYAAYLKTIVDWLLEGGNKKPDVATPRTFDNVGQFAGTIGDNPGSTINVAVGDIGSGANVVFAINSTQAAAVQQRAGEEADKDKREQAIGAVEEQLFYWHQVRDGAAKSGGSTGDKGVIEHVSRRPLSVYFPPGADDLKQKMAADKDNPFQNGYIVNATVIQAKNRPVAYRIDKLHQIIDLPG